MLVGRQRDKQKNKEDFIKLQIQSEGIYKPVAALVVVVHRLMVLMGDEEDPFFNPLSNVIPLIYSGL